MNDENNSEKFLIDANILIQPFHLFRPSIAPNFWNQLKEHIENGNIIISYHVKEEILEGKKDDELKAWFRSLNYNLFDPKFDELTLNVYNELMNLLENCGLYTELSKNEWQKLEKADPWLLSIAKAHNFTVITNEKSKKPNKNNPTNAEPRIPDIGEMMKVKVENFEYMALRLGMIL